MSRNVQPATLALGIGLCVGLFALSRKAKAATASAPPQLPATRAPSSAPPALPSRTSSAEEGQPLAWDTSEHPLASRAIDTDGVTVTPVPLVLDVQADASNIKDMSPAELAALEKRAAERAAERERLARGTVGPPVPKPPAPPAAKPAARPAAKPASKPASKPAAKPAAAAPPVPRPPAATAAVKRSPDQAAHELYKYATQMVNAGKSSQLGTAGAPNATVRAAQADMGVAADGIYGPATRTRGKALIGKTFPARK